MNKVVKRIDVTYLVCPEQDDFVIYYAFKISFLLKSIAFVLDKVSLIF